MTVLEASVRQALVARKSCYLIQAQASPEFSELASRVTSETISYAIGARSKDVSSHLTAVMHPAPQAKPRRAIASHPGELEDERPLES